MEASIPSIIFTAAFGNEDVVVKISSPYGSGGSRYHLMFNDYYQGIIIKILDKWVVLFQVYRDDYTSAELDTLIEKLTDVK